MKGTTMSRAQSLASTEWAESVIDDPSVVFVEVDEDASLYDTGHIPGAVKIDWKAELQAPAIREFIDKKQFEQLLSNKGISHADTILLYGGNSNRYATYIYWYLKYYGHANVKIIDGGRKKWILDGRRLVTEISQRKPALYRAQKTNMSIRAQRDEVISMLGTCNFIDVRSSDEFTGRIPGAINIPWDIAIRADGTFKSSSDLQTLYAEAGIDFGRESIAYSRIGERSSHAWFVLREILQISGVKNYDGLWTEYGSLVGAPIQVGA